MPKPASDPPNARHDIADRISLDELLEVQLRQAFRGTVEAIEDNPEAVKITPWVPGAGCLCHMALVVPRRAINGVTMTEDTHFCCGKTLRVVELDFANDAVIPLRDLFNQIGLSASASVEHMRRPTPRLSPMSRLRAEITGDRSRPFLGKG